MVRREKIEKIEINGPHSIGSPIAIIRIHKKYIEPIKFSGLEAIERSTIDRNDLVSFFKEIIDELKKIKTTL